jgi:2-keto-3-deoxy-L-rhamnonate aldolase RhmA
MKKYVIEREIPGVDKMGPSDLSVAAKTSNAALAQLAPKVQWVQSYVAKDKTFCIYLAENEDAIREHARLSGFPANKITEITGMIDPTTARG